MKDVTNVDSNSKSGDTLACGYCGMPMTSARHLTLHIGMAHPPIKAILPEPPQDTCGCLCHNPDALKWGCEHCAMPPQYTTIQDVVNGTPKGQEAVQKAIDNSIKVQNEMTKKAQDTSLDDILAILDDHHSIVTDELGKSCAKELLAWHKAEQAKINHLIVLAKLEGFDIAFDCHDYDRLRAYKEQLTKELGDSEAEKNSGTWSRV